MENVSSAVISILKKLKIDTLFVIPGSLMEILYDIANDGSFNVISACHEEQLGYMAMGYYNATGKMAAIMVSQGPGETNLITALATANREQVPMLVMSSFQNDRSKLYFQQTTGEFHNPDLFSLTTGVCDFCVRMETYLNEDDVKHIVGEVSKNNGPSYIAVNNSKEDEKGILQEYINTAEKRQNEDMLGIIGDIVKNCDNVAFVVGAGVGNAAAGVIAELQKYDCPIFYTLKAMDKFCIPYKNVMGRIGKMGNVGCNEYLAEKCCKLIVLGASLNSNTIAKWFRKFMARKGEIVHFGIEDTPVCKSKEFHYYKFDSNDFTGQPISGAPREASASPLDRVLHSGDELKSFVFEAYRPSFIPHFNLQDEEKFMLCTGFGPLGSCISVAAGAALADRNRIYVVTCGDGGWLFSGFTLLNLSRHNLPVFVIINVNKEYRTVADGQRNRINQTIAADLYLPELSVAGEFFHLRTVFADSIQDIQKAYDEFRCDRKPTVLFMEDKLYELNDKSE